jgi:hypothetical protein
MLAKGVLMDARQVDKCLEKIGRFHLAATNVVPA